MSMVTLRFGDGLEATVSGDEYDRIRGVVLSGFETSHSVDKIGIEEALRRVIDDPGVPRFHTQLVHLTLRLASKLGIPFPGRLSNNAQQLLLDIGKFYRATQNAYDISGGVPFTSLDDGTYYGVQTNDGANQFQSADPRVAKVNRVLRRHLPRVPTDRDIDTFSYMYFGSDAFATTALASGIQNRHYTVNGRHTRRDEYDAGGNPIRIRRQMRRNQRRVRRLRGPRGQLVPRYEYGSNSDNRSNYSSSNSNSNSNSGNTLTSRSAKYTQNKSLVNANKAKNKSLKNHITWEQQIVNKLPKDPITLNTFSNGQKAVKIHPTANHYVSPQTFRSMARTSMTDAFNKHGNVVLFENPLTRQNVRRSNIKFVIIKNKNTVRATMAKKNAANMIGDARRRQLKRRRT
jgi:hypothetical protein